MVVLRSVDAGSYENGYAQSLKISSLAEVGHGQGNWFLTIIGGGVLELCRAGLNCAATTKV